MLGAAACGIVYAFNVTREHYPTPCECVSIMHSEQPDSAAIAGCLLRINNDRGFKLNFSECAGHLPQDEAGNEGDSLGQNERHTLHPELNQEGVEKN